MEIYTKLTTGTFLDLLNCLYVMFVITTWIYFTCKFIFSAYRQEIIEKTTYHNLTVMKHLYNQENKTANDLENESENDSN